MGCYKILSRDSVKESGKEKEGDRGRVRGE